MRFYFHVRSDEDFCEDLEGVDLPSLDAAKLEAERASREMVAELVLHKERIDHKCFEVTNEAGAVVMKLPFADVIRI